MFYNGQKIETKRLIGVCKKENNSDPKITFKNHMNEEVCYISIIEKRKCIELIIHTAEKFRNKGYMSEALNEFFITAFKNSPKLLINNYISKSNDSSMHLHKKFGFKESNNNFWSLNKMQFKKNNESEKRILKEEYFFLSEVQENINFEKNFLQSFNL